MIPNKIICSYHHYHTDAQGAPWWTFLPARALLGLCRPDHGQKTSAHSWRRWVSAAVINIYQQPNLFVPKQRLPGMGQRWFSTGETQWLTICWELWHQGTTGEKTLKVHNFKQVDMKCVWSAKSVVKWSMVVLIYFYKKVWPWYVKKVYKKVWPWYVKKSI